MTLILCSGLVGYALACPGEQSSPVACPGEQSSPVGFGLACGRQSCLQAAFQAAFSALAIHGARSGRQSCQQPPFRRPANPEHWRSQRFFGFVSCRYRDGKPEKFVKGRASRLKAGSRQDCLPHKRAKAQQAAFQAASSMRDEFLGLRNINEGGQAAGEIHTCRSSCARLDKLKHVPPKSAETSLGAADTSVRATSGHRLAIEARRP
jgi:hypothetical protein